MNSHGIVGGRSLKFYMVQMLTYVRARRPSDYGTIRDCMNRLMRERERRDAAVRAENNKARKKRAKTEMR